MDRGDSNYDEETTSDSSVEKRRQKRKPHKGGKITREGNCQRCHYLGERSPNARFYGQLRESYVCHHLLGGVKQTTKS